MKWRGGEGWESGEDWWRMEKIKTRKECMGLFQQTDTMCFPIITLVVIYGKEGAVSPVMERRPLLEANPFRTHPLLCNKSQDPNRPWRMHIWKGGNTHRKCLICRRCQLPSPNRYEFIQTACLIRREMWCRSESVHRSRRGHFQVSSLLQQKAISRLSGAQICEKD